MQIVQKLEVELREINERLQMSLEESKYLQDHLHKAHSASELLQVNYGSLHQENRTLQDTIDSVREMHANQTTASKQQMADLCDRLDQLQESVAKEKDECSRLKLLEAQLHLEIDALKTQLGEKDQHVLQCRAEISRLSKALYST